MTPKKAKGRPSVLSSDEVQKIVDFVKLNAHNRRLNFLELASGPFRYLGVSERVIKKELNLKGIKRHPAQKKPPAFEVIKRKRREWAESHLDWTVDDWGLILWTDETWVQDENHARRWVSREVRILFRSDKSSLD